MQMMFSENTEEPCDLSLTEGDQIIDIGKDTTYIQYM